MHLLGRETISNKLFWLIFLGGQFPKPCWANVGTFVVCVEHALVPLGGPVAELSWKDFFKTFLLMFFWWSSSRPTSPLGLVYQTRPPQVTKPCIKVWGKHCNFENKVSLKSLGGAVLMFWKGSWRWEWYPLRDILLLCLILQWALFLLILISLHIIKNIWYLV